MFQKTILTTTKSWIHSADSRREPLLLIDRLNRTRFCICLPVAEYESYQSLQDKVLFNTSLRSGDMFIYECSLVVCADCDSAAMHCIKHRQRMDRHTPGEAKQFFSVSLPTRNPTRLMPNASPLTLPPRSDPLLSRRKKHAKKKKY